MEENKQVVAEWKATNQERLTEIKSFNPELYSAINLALNYLNKSLTGEELPKEVEEVKVQPTQQEGFWRIMTEKELINKYGTIEKAAYDIGWNAKGEMDWMYGMPVKDLIKDDLTEEQIEYELKDVIETDPLKDKNNKSWFIFRGFTIFDTSNVKPKVNEAQTQLSGWRIKTKEEIKKENLDYLGISDKVWEEIYGKPIEDLYVSQSQVNDAISLIKANLRPPALTKGIASSYTLLPKYFSSLKLSTTIPNLVYRFKTLDEMRNEGLGTAGGAYYGVNEETIKKYAGKSLDELYDDGYLGGNTIKEVIENINNKENIYIAGYKFPIDYFTDQPLTAEATSGFKLSVETIPATLKRDYRFIANTGNRKAPSQSAGNLYSRYANLPAAKAELFNTFFKGNDGTWWKLKQVGTEWRWEKSSPQPSQTSTSEKNIDQMIKEASQKYMYNRSISNLPPYLKQLAINNQIEERGVVNEKAMVTVGFSWSKTKEGPDFWQDVAIGEFLSQRVLDVIGSKEKLFEMPPKQSAEQPKTETKQEWEPQDLVGKTLLFTSSGKKYRVEKFTRNNPKNKEYKLRDLTSPNTPEVTYQISMSIIKTWLDGNVSKGARIIEETPTGSDYSTWTQIQLNQKRREISDALIAFEEDDPEYKELKDQLDIIDTFID